MLRTRTSVWLFAGLWLALSTFYTARAFMHSVDRSTLALLDWGLIALSLVAPLFGVWRLFADDQMHGRASINAAVRLVLIGYLPLWTAMRILDRILPLR